jgi:hypothetical protein
MSKQTCTYAENSPSCSRDTTRQCHPVCGQEGPPGTVMATEPKNYPNLKLTTPHRNCLSHNAVRLTHGSSSITEGAILSSRYATLQLKLAAISRGCSLKPKELTHHQAMLKCSTCHKLLYDRKLQAARMQMLFALSYARECFLSRCNDEGDTGSPPNKRPEDALI